MDDKNKVILEKLRALEGFIGNTPVLNMGDGVWGKLEGENPAGSIKDRAAFYILKRAAERGDLQEGGTVVEATSGNTGIALAYIAREIGVKAVMCMPENMSEQRRKLMSDYGAELVLTPKNDGMAGAVAAARLIEKERGAYVANQFENYAGVEAHLYTTAPELFAQIEGLRYIVAGVGSGGTTMGIAKYIEDRGLNCSVVAVEPASSPLMSKGYAGTHGIQGIGANFVPKLVNKDKFFKIMTVEDQDALQNARFIYQKFNIKCGISSGAAYCAAKRLRDEVDGSIAAILPDNGSRYPEELYV